MTVTRIEELGKIVEHVKAQFPYTGATNDGHNRAADHLKEAVLPAVIEQLKQRRP